MIKKLVNKHLIERMMDEARRGVAPQEHDYKAEKPLVIAFQNGDEQAGFELIKMYQDCFSVIINKPAKPPFNKGGMSRLWDGSPSREDYEDMYQEILCQFIEMVKEFDTSEETPLVNKVRKTLHQRFFNRYFSEFIENRTVEEEFDDKINLSFEFDISVDDTDNVPAKYLELYQAMNELSDKERRVLEYSVVKGWNASEIQQEMGTKTNVRMIKKRALEKLQKLLSKEG
jgi:RNA polymerase sigma factor (sigma-70 family)